MVVVNDESATVSVATGSAPDAATATATAASTAGTPIASGGTAVMALNKGDKVNIKASA